MYSSIVEVKAITPDRENCNIRGKDLRSSLPYLALVLMSRLFPPSTLAQNQIPEYRNRFTQETDAVRRAQKMSKLGEAEFDEIARDIEIGKLSDGLAVLIEYRDEIQSCERGLDAKSIDAENHPKGFKQLEISLRESLRRLNNLLPGLTADEKAPLLDVRADLGELNQHLIHELFPR